MKNLLRASLAAAALVASTGAAQAQTISYNTDYSTGLTGFFGALAYAGGIGTVYRAGGAALGNTETATPNVATTFTLRGNVTKDCSFYAGNSAAARDINLGTIGVRTGNGENVSDAFDMRAPAVAGIQSGTAGCNFNNTVTIAKANGVNGLVNGAAGGYDAVQFQANIPYSIDAEWTGTTSQSAGVNGSTQTRNVATNEASETWTGGAWRSEFTMGILVPTPSKALVAGNYQDQITVTLTAS